MSVYNSGIDKLVEWKKDPSIFVREVFNVEPDGWQDKVLKAFPTNSRIALKASKGVGKEHCKSLIIPTPDGFKQWGDLKIGDNVFAEDGSITTIINTFEQGVKDVYRITFNDGSSTLCGGEHLWKVKGQRERARNNNSDWIVIDTKEIIKRGVRVSNGKWEQRQFEIPIQGAAQFPTKKLPVDCYLFGIWLGDGSKGEPSYCKPYIEVEQEINKRGYKTNRAVDGKQVRILDSVTDFKQLECFDCYSYQRFIPLDYKLGSIEQRKDLISGLLDSDGCIGKENNHVEYATTSKQLAEDIVWLVRSLGGRAVIKDSIKKPFYYDKDRNKIAGRDCYRVSSRLPFNPFKIKHKAERWKPANTPTQSRYFKRYIDNIELISREDSMCIEIAHPSHCYLVNDFIVTHNTATLAWLAWNFILTRPESMLIAISTSAESLSSNFWTEMARWHSKSEILKEQFVWTSSRIYAKSHPATWYALAKSYPKTSDPTRQGDALAGYHNKHIMFIIDESGGMHDSILASAEAALSNCIEGHIVQAGNPTHLSGPLYRACTTNASAWYVQEISSDPADPNRSNLVPKAWAEEQIKLWGRDNPFVLVNVFGKFPAASFNSLIGVEEVEEAMNRDYRPDVYIENPRILGVDVSRFGDDCSIIFPRQGLQSFIPFKYRNLDSIVGANYVADKVNTWHADNVFIDDTGGFGAGWIDNLRRLGYTPIGVNFSSKPENIKYANKRAEMYLRMCDWIKSGGALPRLPELKAQLTQTTYNFTSNGSLIIEPKDMVKAKIGYSPDEADALALTFAYNAIRAAKPKNQLLPQQMNTHYDPLAYDHVIKDLGVQSRGKNNRPNINMPFEYSDWQN